MALAILEERRPLRHQTQPKLRRDIRNLALAALSTAIIAIVEAPFVRPVSQAADARRLGLVQRIQWPAWARTAVAVVAMDYTQYLWHRLQHHVPLLWRSHRVHHADLDMDASTAVRIHFLEFVASAPWRMAQVALLGVGPGALAIWRTLTLASIFFHHANLRLDPVVDRRLEWLVMTPRLHGIHHSVAAADQHSNLSNGLTLWDRLHGTLRSGPAQPSAIGLADWRDPERLRLSRLLAMPADAGREQAR